MQQKVNHHIQCNVKDCQNHCLKENYCSLDNICVGSSASELAFTACTDCQSYKCGVDRPAINLSDDMNSIFHF